MSIKRYLGPERHWEDKAPLVTYSPPTPAIPNPNSADPESRWLSWESQAHRHIYHSWCLGRVREETQVEQQCPRRPPQSATAACSLGRRRGFVLAPQGDGPVECDGVEPEAVGPAARSAALSKLPFPEAMVR